ncbi:MAG: DEAD/DEAH box helicase [Planctomycetia bacterium]|nr:DEAD/DEAH box helicase [Planctomycetia bacterium]
MAKKIEQNQNNENASQESDKTDKNSSNKKASARKHTGSQPRHNFQWGEVDDVELGEVITPLSTGKKKKRRKGNKSPEDVAETRFQIYHAKPRHAEDPSLPSYGRLLMGEQDDEDEAYSNLEALFGGDDDESESRDVPQRSTGKSGKKRRKKSSGSTPAASAEKQSSQDSRDKEEESLPIDDEWGLGTAESARAGNTSRQKQQRVPDKNASDKNSDKRNLSQKNEGNRPSSDKNETEKKETVRQEPRKKGPEKQGLKQPPKAVAASAQNETEPSENAPRDSAERTDDISPRRIRGLKRRTATKLKSLGVADEKIVALIKLGETSPVSVLFHMLETLLDTLTPLASESDAKDQAVSVVPNADATETDFVAEETQLHSPDFVDSSDTLETDNSSAQKKKRKGKNKFRADDREKTPVSSQNKTLESLLEEVQTEDVHEQVQTKPVPHSSEKEQTVAEKESGFAKLGLSGAMLRTLSETGYETPTPVQAGTIQQVLSGIDLIGQAKTGTGKTAAFAIPIIEQVAQCKPGDNPVALVVVPTRELAVQVRDEMVKLAGNHEVAVVACYGGKPIADQIKKMSSGVDVVVGTPGRILDLVKRRALSLDELRWVVLDEADRMLDIGFRPDIERILKQTPLSRQTLLFSATLPPPVTVLARKYMKDPKQFDFSEENISAETIEQYYITVDANRKFDALIHLIKKEQPKQAIVFCRTKRAVDRIGNHLQKIMEGVSLMHGDLSQDVRDRVMRNFRAGKVGILVATDVVGRGIDVSGISHIINYDIPEFCDDYVHRVGRTGRMGREGVAFTLVTSEEGTELTRIEKRINQLLTRVELPDFRAFTAPGETDNEEKQVSKPVFGHSVRRVRRAL